MGSHEHMTIYEILRKQNEEATKRGKRGNDETKNEDAKEVSNRGTENGDDNETTTV